jgi:hypothetical protein
MLAREQVAAGREPSTGSAAGRAVVDTVAPEPYDPPLVLNPAELRQLWQAYHELLDLHHAEVVEAEDFEDAHRLLVEQVLPLRDILRAQEHLIVDSRVELTY